MDPACNSNCTYYHTSIGSSQDPAVHLHFTRRTAGGVSHTPGAYAEELRAVQTLFDPPSRFLAYLSHSFWYLGTNQLGHGLV
jgi:hypothetical protein